MVRDLYLYDDIGRKYERKNEYLKELIELEKSGDAAAISSFKSKRSSHPYILDLEKYRSEEKDFFDGLKSRIQKEAPESCQLEDSKLKELCLQQREASIKKDFYHSIREFEYDFKYEYLKNEKIDADLDIIIQDYKKILKEISDAKEALAKVSETAEAEAKEEIARFKSELDKKLAADMDDLKRKKTEKIISQKAYKNEQNMLMLKAKDLMEDKAFVSDRHRLTERLKSLEYELKHGTENRLKVMEDNLSSIRRNVPVEVETENTAKMLITIPFPGLGQLFNGQVNKGIFLAILGLIAYLVAIPYALGYGNYQGKGIIGLITLADGAARTHKSLIYMIEGIIAVVLLIFAILVLYLAFNDANRVAKNTIRGIRPNNWFETKNFLQRGGLPFIVNVPALILIVFIVIVPIVTAILLSFTGMDPKHQSKFPWVGLENYLTIATGKGLAGSVFWKILLWTFIWTIGASSLAILVGFVLAIIANNERILGKGVFRSIFILPWAVPAFITIMFFSIMVSPNGILTDIINKYLGLELVIKNSTIGTRVFLIFLQAWLGSSYIFLLTTGVLQAIPNDLYEAAMIDGATGIQQTMKITIPLVLFQISPLLVTQYTFNFNNFSIIYLFNQGGPFNPTEYGNLAGSSDILISYVYKLTMENQYQAMGAVITILISFGLMLIAYLGFRNSAALKED